MGVLWRAGGADRRVVLIHIRRLLPLRGVCAGRRGGILCAGRGGKGPLATRSSELLTAFLGSLLVDDV